MASRMLLVAVIICSTGDLMETRESVMVGSSTSAMVGAGRGEEGRWGCDREVGRWGGGGVVRGKVCETVAAA